MASKIDKEKAKKSIALILDRLKAEADLGELNEYRSVFKKEISLFRRSWAAAYLLMSFDKNSLGFHGNQAEKGRNRRFQPEHRSFGRKQAENNNSAEETPDKNREPQTRQYPLAEDESTRIFISIGRNRRMFPREILGLIISKCGVSRDDIGVIRILENYSFVQVRDAVAEPIINTLNGCIFRGRTLTVNYAKIRRDCEENSWTSADSQSPANDREEIPPEYSDRENTDDNEYPETDESGLDEEDGISKQNQD